MATPQAPRPAMTAHWARLLEPLSMQAVTPTTAPAAQAWKPDLLKNWASLPWVRRGSAADWLPLSMLLPVLAHPVSRRAPATAEPTSSFLREAGRLRVIGIVPLRILVSG